MRITPGLALTLFSILGPCARLLAETQQPAQVPDPQGADSRRPPTPAERQQRLDDLARSALLQIVLRYPPDKAPGAKEAAVERVQAAFRVDESGLALTSCAALLGAARVEARLPGQKPSVTAQVLAIDPSRDLALIRVEPGTAPAGAGTATPSPASAPVASAASAANPAAPRGFVRVRAVEAVPFESETWTLAWQPATEPRALADASLVEGLRVVDSNRPPVLTRAILAGGLDGWPLVDADGQLIAIWPHAWSETPAGLLWTTAQDSAALLERGRSSKPLKAEEWTAILRAQPVRPRAFPCLDWSRVPAADACTDVIERANKLSSFTGCPHCGATGKTTEPGARHWDPRREKMVDGPSTTKTCEECKGSRMASATALWRAMRELAKKLASLSAARPATEIDSASKRVETALGAVSALNPGYLRSCVNDEAREELRPDKLVPGRAIVCILPHGLWPETDAEGWGERVRLVVGSEFGNLILRGILTRSTIAEGYSVFLSGTVAGSVQWGDREFVVLERCFVVPINPR